MFILLCLSSNPPLQPKCLLCVHYRLYKGKDLDKLRVFEEQPYFALAKLGQTECYLECYFFPRIEKFKQMFNQFVQDNNIFLE
jgi:hypothetical protein